MSILPHSSQNGCGRQVLSHIKISRDEPVERLARHAEFESARPPRAEHARVRAVEGRDVEDLRGWRCEVAERARVSGTRRTRSADGTMRASCATLFISARLLELMARPGGLFVISQILFMSCRTDDVPALGTCLRVHPC